MLAITLAVTGAQAPHVTAEIVATIAVLGIIGTGFAYVLNYQIIASEGATIASTVPCQLPVVAIRARASWSSARTSQPSWSLVWPWSWQASR
jgi:hypothetical protein